MTISNVSSNLQLSNDRSFPSSYVERLNPSPLYGLSVYSIRLVQKHTLNHRPNIVARCLNNPPRISISSITTTFCMVLVIHDRKLLWQDIRFRRTPFKLRVSKLSSWEPRGDVTTSTNILVKMCNERDTLPILILFGRRLYGSFVTTIGFSKTSESF